MRLQATLIGDVSFSCGGEAVVPTSRKGTALLAFLCLVPEGATRDELAELLWGAGRLANLRQELYALRRLPGSEAWLSDQGDVLAVQADSDAVALAGVSGTSAGATVEALAAGAGELLPGLERIEAPAFRDWLDLERRRIAGSQQRVRREAAAALSSDGQHREALDLLLAALRSDPFDESLLQKSMRTAYAAGDAPAALASYERFCEQVHEELGMTPSPETVELERRIRSGEPLETNLDFAELGSDLRPLAQAVAVADGSLDVEQLAGVVERPPLAVAADLARLERGGWLDDRLRLAPAGRDTVLAATPDVVARLMHQRVATAMTASAEAEPSTVAEHLLAAGRALDAAPLLLQAGKRSVAAGDLAAACQHLLRALWAAWGSPEVRLEAAFLLEGCAGQTGDEALQDAALTEAEDLAWRLQSDRGLAEAKMRRSRTCLRRGQTGDGLENALEALEIATRLDDHSLIAKARNAVGGAQYYAGDVDGAEQSFTLNLDTEDPVERFRARNNLGSIAGVRGRPREALAHLEVALTLGRAAGEHVSVVGTLNNVAATAEGIGDYRRAVKYFKEGLALARQTRSVANEGQLLVNLSVVYSRLGELGPAWNTAVEVEDMAAERRDVRLRMLALEQRAEVSLLCGDLTGAGALLESAERLAVRLGDERKERAFAVGRVVVAARLDPASQREAEARLEELAEPRWANVIPWLWLELALVATEPGDATRWAGKAEPWVGENEHLSYLLDLSRLRASLLPGGDPDDDEVTAACQRLSRADDARDEAQYVQAPHARLLLACWRSRGEPDPGPRDDALRLVRSELKEQTAGLPKSLRALAQELPGSWLAALDPLPLTSH